MSIVDRARRLVRGLSPKCPLFDPKRAQAVRRCEPPTRVETRIEWYENSAGDGSAWTARTISTAADFAQSVFAADVDGDGDTDVLSASPQDDKIAWYENVAGTGTPWTSRTISTAQDISMLRIDAAHRSCGSESSGVGGSSPVRILCRPWPMPKAGLRLRRRRCRRRTGRSDRWRPWRSPPAARGNVGRTGSRGMGARAGRQGARYETRREPDPPRHAVGAASGCRVGPDPEALQGSARRRAGKRMTAALALDTLPTA